MFCRKEFACIYNVLATLNECLGAVIFQLHPSLFLHTLVGKGSMSN